MSTKNLRSQFEALKDKREYREYIDHLKIALDGRCAYCDCELFEDEVLRYRYPEWLYEENSELPRYFTNRTWFYHVDHRTPLSRGGTNKLSNLTLACPSCNSRKGNRLAEDFMTDERRA